MHPNARRRSCTAGSVAFLTPIRLLALLYFLTGALRIRFPAGPNTATTAASSRSGLSSNLGRTTFTLVRCQGRSLRSRPPGRVMTSMGGNTQTEMGVRGLRAIFAMYVERAPRHPRCRASRLLFALCFPDSSSPRRGPPTDGRRKHCGTSPLPTPAHALRLLYSIPFHVNGTAGSRITPLGSPPH